MNAAALYEIRVAGHLSRSWETQLGGLSIRLEPGGETVLVGMLDQPALHGVLMRIRDLGLNLVSVSRSASDASA